LSSCCGSTPSRAVRSTITPNPYLVTKRWAYEQYFAWWHGSESSSPQWLARVAGALPGPGPRCPFPARLAGTGAAARCTRSSGRGRL
jgi:hypothetical protein